MSGRSTLLVHAIMILFVDSFFLIPPEGGLDLVLTGRVPSNRR